MDNCYYVYEYWRLDNNTCFYVGKGKKYRCNILSNRSDKFKNILNKTECAMVIVADNLTEEEAHQIECYLIHSYVFEEGYGINCKGHETISGVPYLVNTTWGGEGHSGCKGSIKGENNPMYGKHHSIETKEKISNLHKMNKYWLGRKHSNESKQKMSETRKGTQVGELNNMYGKRHTDEAKKKIGEKNKRKIICLDTGRVFNSLLEASEWCGVTSTALVNCCKGKTKTSGGFHWRYYEDYLKECA